MFLARGLLGAAFVAWAANAAAQQVPEEEDLALAYGDKNFVHIATGNRQPLRNAPSTATVITAEEIAAMGATDLDEVLEAVPGLHVNRSTNTYPPLYVVRGIVSTYNPQVLMLVNGKPVTDMFVGNRGNAWGGLPVENISRIEVIRGPGSALYGADAFAGTINIITKTASEINGTQFGVRAGSFNTWSTWAQHGGQLGPIEVAAYVQAGSTDGQHRIIRQDAQSSQLDPKFGTHASYAPGSVHLGRETFDAGLDLGYGRWRLRLGVKDRLNMETGAGVANSLDPQGNVASHRVNADLSWSEPQLTKDWSLSFDARFMHLSEEFGLDLYPAGAKLSPTSVFPNGMIGNPSRWQRQFGLSATAQYTGFADHRLRMGVGHDILDLYKIRESRNYVFVGRAPVPLSSVVDVSDIDRYVMPYKRKLSYLYLQDEWGFARDWTLTAGLRYDRYSDFGGTTNPRVALVWNTTQDLTAKFMYGTAFRAPTINEFASINNPVNRGNPDLRPEKITTLEAGITWQARQDTEVNLSVFRHEMTDIIRLVPNTDGTGTTYQNTGKQTGSGGEIEVIWDAGPNLRLSGNYAYQKNIDETTKQDAGYAPHHHVYARADWRFSSAWQLNGQVNYVADRARPAGDLLPNGDLRPKIPDYTTVDLTLRTNRPKNGWDYAASIRNLFDADVREPSLSGSGIIYDLPMPRRTFYLQAIYHL